MLRVLPFEAYKPVIFVPPFELVPPFVQLTVLLPSPPTVPVKTESSERFETITFMPTVPPAVKAAESPHSLKNSACFSSLAFMDSVFTMLELSNFLPETMAETSIV